MKRKVIIADDEQHICHLIKALIEWEQYGLEVVGFANDGNKAFQMCGMQPGFSDHGYKNAGIERNRADQEIV